MLLPIRNMGSSSTGGIPNLVHLESTNYGINGSWQMSLWFLLGNSLYNINGGFLENHETKWWIFFSKPPLDYQRVSPPSKITIVCWLYQVISQEFPEIATDSHHKIRKKPLSGHPSTTPGFSPGFWLSGTVFMCFKSCLASCGNCAWSDLNVTVFGESSFPCFILW